MAQQDPFSSPAAVTSTFPSADSFRGRLVIIEATSIERNVPKSDQKGAQIGNKITATVTVVDGAGPVQLYAYRVPQNQWLEGPVFHGVWFNQDRIALKGGLVTGPNADLVTTPVLCRLETFKPGKPAGQGNPWGLVDPTEEDKALARKVLAGLTVDAAATPAPAPAADESNPFATNGGAPF